MQKKNNPSKEKKRLSLKQNQLNILIHFLNLIKSQDHHHLKLLFLLQK